MQIHGLQPMTLLDFPGMVACTVFLGGCDLRCPFCHNAELIDASARPVMDDRQLLDFLARRRGLIDGVCLTGGEPLLRKELPGLMRAVKDLGYLVKLDTNGTHPESLAGVLGQGLADYVAMDVKDAPSRYAVATGRADVDVGAVRESAALLLGGGADYEFRTTVVRELHGDDTFHEIGAWISGARRYFLQPFADRGTVPSGGLHPPERRDLLRYLDISRAYVESAKIRGE